MIDMSQEESWVEHCLEHLEQFGLEWSTGRSRAGAQSTHSIAVSDGQQTWVFRTECARHIRPSTAAYRLGSLRSAGANDGAALPLMLFAERITDSIGEILREQSVNYVDTAGNAWIQQPGLRIWIEGRPPTKARKAQPKATTPTALQLIFLLLKDRRWCERSYRELAERTGLALGTIGWNMNALIHAGHVQRLQGQRRLRAPLELLATWEQNWHDRLRPRLDPKSCKGSPDPAFESLLRRCAQNSSWLVGGELAATCVIEGVQAASATIHVPPDQVRNCMRRLNLIPHPEGNVHLLETFGQENAWNREAGRVTTESGATLADPLLVRAELLGSRDERIHALANELLEGHVTPRWAD